MFESLRRLTTTPLKLRLLLELQNAKSIVMLSRSLKVPRDTIKPHLRKFINMNLVEKCKEGYKLTNLGHLVLEKVSEIEKLLSLSENVGVFFNTHDIASIPKDLQREIHSLYGGYVIKKKNPYDLHDIWVEILKNSMWIRGVSSVYHPKFPTLFTELAEDGKEVYLVLTEEVFNRCKIEHLDLLQRFINSGGKMYIRKDARIAFIVAEKGFAMNLYTSEGYDAINTFICKSEDCLHWGLKLFDYFLKESKAVNQEVFEDTHNKNQDDNLKISNNYWKSSIRSKNQL